MITCVIEELREKERIEGLKEIDKIQSAVGSAINSAWRGVWDECGRIAKEQIELPMKAKDEK